MPVIVETGTWTGNNTTPQTITLANGSLTPVAIIVWMVRQGAAAAGFVASQALSIGFGTRRGGATQSGCIGLWSTDNVATTACGRVRNTTLLHVLSAPTTTDYTVSLSAFAAGSFTVTYSSAANANGDVFAYMVIGGLSDAIVLNKVLANATGNPEAETGAGFRPNCLLCLDADLATDNTPTLNIAASFGCATSSTRFWSVAVTEDDGAVMTTAMNWNKAARTDACLERLDINADTSNARWDLDSFDNDGFTLGVVDGPSATDRISTFLLLAGGTFEAGSKNKSAATGNDTFTLAATNLTVEGIILGCIRAATGITLNSADLMLGAGSTANATRASAVNNTIGIVGPETINTTADRFSATDSVIEELTGGAAPAETSEAWFDTKSTGSFIIDWAVNGGSTNPVFYLAMGNPLPLPSVQFPSRLDPKAALLTAEQLAFASPTSPPAPTQFPTVFPASVARPFYLTAEQLAFATDSKPPAAITQFPTVFPERVLRSTYPATEQLAFALPTLSPECPPVELGDSTSSSGAGNETVAKPAGVVNGTVLVACVGHNMSPITPPAGFVQQGNSATFDAGFAGFNWQQEVYLKVVVDAASEPASYSFTGGTFTDIWMVAVHNVDNAVPVPAGGTTARPVAPATGTTANGASCTVARDGSLLLRFETSNSENRATGPPGMTPLPGSPIDTSFNADYEHDLLAGATGDRDSTYTNTQTWIVHMIVLQAECPIPLPSVQFPVRLNPALALLTAAHLAFASPTAPAAFVQNTELVWYPDWLDRPPPRQYHYALPPQPERTSPLEDVEFPDRLDHRQFLTEEQPFFALGEPEAFVQQVELVWFPDGFVRPIFRSGDFALPSQPEQTGPLADVEFPDRLDRRQYQTEEQPFFAFGEPEAFVQQVELVWFPDGFVRPIFRSGDFALPSQPEQTVALADVEFPDRLDRRQFQTEEQPFFALGEPEAFVQQVELVWFPDGLVRPIFTPGDFALVPQPEQTIPFEDVEFPDRLDAPARQQPLAAVAPLFTTPAPDQFPTVFPEIVLGQFFGAEEQQAFVFGQPPIVPPPLLEGPPFTWFPDFFPRPAFFVVQHFVGVELVQPNPPIPPIPPKPPVPPTPPKPKPKKKKPRPAVFSAARTSLPACPPDLLLDQFLERVARDACAIEPECPPAAPLVIIEPPRRFDPHPPERQPAPRQLVYIDKVDQSQRHTHSFVENKQDQRVITYNFAPLEDDTWKTVLLIAVGVGLAVFIWSIARADQPLSSPAPAARPRTAPRRRR